MVLKNTHRLTPFESPSWSLVVKPESNINRDTRQFFSDTVDGSPSHKQESPKADLKHQQKKVYEITLAGTLALLILTFQLVRHFSLTPTSMNTVDVNIEVVDVSITEQFQRPSPPARPSTPVPTEEESIPEDVTIASTEIDLSDIPSAPPPPGEDNELPTFVSYDKPPQIIGGFTELQRHLKYPKIAINARIEGIVFVRVTVGVDGRTENVEIIKAKPANCGFEEAAVEAIKKVRWEAAKQRDKRIRVWVTIPVQFKLFGS